MKCKIKSGLPYLIIVALAAVFSYGYSIAHFAIGVDDTAMELFFEDGLSVCTNRWTLFFLNRVLHFNIIHWPTWLVESLSVCILVLAFSLWCFLAARALASVGVVLPGWFYGMAAALAVSCPIISEIWVYYFHGGISIGYGFTALAMLLFLQSLEHGGRYGFLKILGSGLCLATALGCYETMMDCFLIGALFLFMILHALSDKKSNPKYDIRFLSWMVRGTVALVVSLAVRALMHEILMAAYHLDSMAKYGMNDYNPVFGDLFQAHGALGMLIKRTYLRYFVNGVAYLPIAFLVLSWAIIGSLAIYYAVKRKDPWVAACAPAMVIVPVLSSIVAGKVKAYHSAQFVPLVIMSAFLLCGMAVLHGKGAPRRILRTGFVVIAVGGILVQVKDMNKWFVQDYDKYLETRRIMEDAARELLANYDTEKPVVVVGAALPSDELCREACVPMDSWKYRMIAKLTSFDPTIKEKYHTDFGGWGYSYAESPLLSVLTWARNPFENCDLAASQQYTSYWEMIGYDNFTYVPSAEMIEEAERTRESTGMPGYPHEGYIVDNGNMLIINLSEVD